MLICILWGTLSPWLVTNHAAFRTWPFIIFTCVGCLVMSLIIVKLKVHACKFQEK